LTRFPVGVRITRSTGWVQIPQTPGADANEAHIDADRVVVTGARPACERGLL